MSAINRQFQHAGIAAAAVVLMSGFSVALRLPAQEDGYSILTIAEPFEYRFPDESQAFLQAFHAPLVDRGQVFFTATEGGLGTTWIQFVADDGRLIRVMDNITPFPESDPPLLPWLLTTKSFRNGAGLSLLSDPFLEEYGLALVTPMEGPRAVVDTLPVEPGGTPEFNVITTGVFVGENIAFHASDGSNLVNHFRHELVTGKTTPIFPDPANLSVEGVSVRWLHGPVTGDALRVVAMADLEPAGDSIPVAYDLDGNLEALAWIGDPVPGIGGTIAQVHPTVLGIAGANHVILAISGEAPDVRQVLMGTMDGRPDEPEVFVKTGDPVPGSPGLEFFAFEGVSVARDAFVFMAAFEDAGTRRGLYLWKDGQIEAVYDTRQELSGRPVATITLDAEGFDGDFVGFRGDFGGNLNGVFLKRVRPWPPTLQAWKEASFTVEELADERISGDAANPDGDPFTNLLEYLTGQEPKNADLLETPRIEEGRAVFTFPVAYGVEDYVLEAEFSHSLSGWASDGIEVVDTTDAAEHEWLTVGTIEPVTQRVRGFFRLVARPVPAEP